MMNQKLSEASKKNEGCGASIAEPEQSVKKYSVTLGAWSSIHEVRAFAASQGAGAEQTTAVDGKGMIAVAAAA
jgi:hypothetical protein